MCKGDNTPIMAPPVSASSSSSSLSFSSKKSSSSNEDHPDNDENNDFLWSATEEPHATRRKLILEKYPQIKELYGIDPYLKYKITFLVVLQLGLAFLFRHQRFFRSTEEDDSSYPSWFFFAVCYVIGGTSNHALLLANHELSHNLGFTKPSTNRWFSIFANIPTVFPSAISFKRYHIEHHRYQGYDGVDVDIPTHWEGTFFRNAFTKFLFVVFQIFFYALRPSFVNPKVPNTKYEFANWIVLILTNAVMYYAWGGASIVYLLLSLLFGTGLHPVAGHFIAEHYVFDRNSDQETFSYYGPCNAVMFNVGYHNEHHDFPYIPGSRLPLVRKMAPEFYDTLHSYDSYVHVLWDYIFNPNVTAFSRVKRKPQSSEQPTHVKSE
jgi:sphingolipid delta-4 desaturase